MDVSPVGYFSKTHGIKGQLVLKTDTDFFVEDVDAVFIETATGLAPYFVKEIMHTNKDLILQLEDVDVIEKAKLLIGKQVFIKTEFIDKTAPDFDWLGYEVIDKKHGVLGQVFNVSDNGQQLLLSILYNNKEIILPLIENFIEKIDENNKKLFFSAPEGLIDMYLE